MAVDLAARAEHARTDAGSVPNRWPLRSIPCVNARRRRALLCSKWTDRGARANIGSGAHLTCTRVKTGALFAVIENLTFEPRRRGLKRVRLTRSRRGIEEKVCHDH